jgi:hypothetical protein
MLEECYDFNLSIVSHLESGQWHLRIRSETWQKHHREKEVHFPLWTLPLLRQKMATILEKLDGTQQIDEMPIMPEWTKKGILN